MINGFCGTYNGHGFLTPCSTCDKDSCKAAGDMCRWVWKSVAGAKCVATSKGMELEKEARKKGKLTTKGKIDLATVILIVQLSFFSSPSAKIEF